MVWFFNNILKEINTLPKLNPEVCHANFQMLLSWNFHNICTFDFFTQGKVSQNEEIQVLSWCGKSKVHKAKWEYRLNQHLSFRCKFSQCSVWVDFVCFYYKTHLFPNQEHFRFYSTTHSFLYNVGLLLSKIEHVALPYHFDRDVTKFVIQPSSRIHFLSRGYRLVFALDLSPSAFQVSIQSQSTVVENMLSNLADCLCSLVKPVRLWF